MTKIIVLALATILALPVGAATWFAQGTYEPDTKCDDASGCTNPATGEEISGGWMYREAPGSDTDGLRVYLNGYAVAVQGSGVNPNSEVLGSRHQANSLTFYAYFGVWKDCNDDGYIGAANGALHVYASTAIAVDTSICEDGSVFNRGGWVYEFQWIGPGDTLGGSPQYPSADDQRWINDSEARVWSDWDLPGHVSPGGSSCPTGPTFGVTSSTGAMIAHVDCIASRKIANTINDVDDLAGLGIGFEDPNAPYRSSSPLNQDLPFNLFGNPYAGENNDEWQTGLLEYNSNKERGPGYDDDLDYTPSEDERMFDAWDCTQRDEYANPVAGQNDEVDDTVDPDGDGIMFTTGHLAPSVHEDPLHSSAYDGLNATERGTNGFQNWLLEGGTGLGGTRTCSEDEVTNTWQTYGGVEGGEAGTDDVGSGRNAVETLFTFSLGGQPPRGRQTGNAAIDDPLTDETVFAINAEDELDNATGSDTGDALNATLGEGYQFGVNFRGTLLLRPGWTGTPPWLTTAPINRRDLEPAAGRYITVYASIGAATTGLGATTARGNTPALYANEWCEGTFTSDSIADNFDCNAANWYPLAEPQANGISIAIRPGHPYHVRDIDCYDGTVARGVDAQASLAALSELGPCEDSAS